MDNGLIFPYPAVRLKQRDEPPISVHRQVVVVPQGRGSNPEAVWRGFQEKPLWTNGRSVPQTDTGRRGEKPQALERTVVKELGTFTP